MNCEDCQELISVYLDRELDENASITVEAHLASCTECAKLYEDFSLILDTCREATVTEVVPPNSQALWCRINNIIESEIKPEPEPQLEEPKRWFARGWRFTFSQVGSAVVGIAVISSLLTVVGIRNYFEPTGDDFTSRSASEQTTFEKVLAKVGLTETPQQARERRLQEQQAAIEYWSRRVQSRRTQWDARMRDAFDRNLYVIDESVNEYRENLKHNPDDELSGEMLDAVMDDKMALLRSFSDL